MNTTFRFLPFDPATADSLRTDPAAIRYVADSEPGYPCRQCLRDAEIGDELVLVSHDPFTAYSPYRTPSPIFLHAHDCSGQRDESLVPEQIRRRQLSVRAFDAAEMMLDAAVIDGVSAADTIAHLLAVPGVDHVDVHNAVRGCWAGRVVAA